MAKTLPFYKFYPADAEVDANFRSMDDADLGFYWRCLNHAWINGGIPADPKERARVLRTRVDTADKRWERVGKCFVNSTLYPDRLVNPRQESERLLATSKSVKATESIKARYERTTNVPTKEPYARAIASDSVSVSGVVSSSGGVQGGRNSVTDLDGLVSQRFDEFWASWPMKRKRDEAARAWISVVTTENEAAVFVALERFLRSDACARGVVQLPANWIFEQARDGWAGEWPAASRGPVASSVAVPVPVGTPEQQEAALRDLKAMETASEQQPACATCGDSGGTRWEPCGCAAGDRLRAVKRRA